MVMFQHSGKIITKTNTLLMFDTGQVYDIAYKNKLFIVSLYFGNIVKFVRVIQYIGLYCCFHKVGKNCHQWNSCGERRLKHKNSWQFLRSMGGADLQTLLPGVLVGV